VTTRDGSGRFILTDPVDRFWSKVQKTEGCWHWLGSVQQGYGVFAVHHRKSVKAHVFSWEQFNGPKPNNMQLDHKCRYRDCVNPRHLDLVTPKENCQRRPRRFRCLKGHLLTKANSTPRADGYTQCRICKNEAWRNYYARKNSG